VMQSQFSRHVVRHVEGTVAKRQCSLYRCVAYLDRAVLGPLINE
jgi:hypothetical protein